MYDSKTTSFGVITMFAMVFQLVYFKFTDQKDCDNDNANMVYFVLIYNILIMYCVSFCAFLLNIYTNLIICVVCVVCGLCGLISLIIQNYYVFTLINHFDDMWVCHEWADGFFHATILMNYITIICALIMIAFSGVIVVLYGCVTCCCKKSSQEFVTLEEDKIPKV